jgi:hypothetical protein
VGAEGRNAVTWGVFPGHEIEQSTIIDKESFMAWKVRHWLLSVCYAVTVTISRKKHLTCGNNGHWCSPRIRLNALAWKVSETIDGF